VKSIIWIFQDFWNKQTLTTNILRISNDWLEIKTSLNNICRILMSENSVYWVVLRYSAASIEVFLSRSIPSEKFTLWLRRYTIIVFSFIHCSQVYTSLLRWCLRWVQLVYVHSSNYLHVYLALYFTIGEYSRPYCGGIWALYFTIVLDWGRKKSLESLKWRWVVTEWDWALDDWGTSRRNREPRSVVQTLFYGLRKSRRNAIPLGSVQGRIPRKIPL